MRRNSFVYAGLLMLSGIVSVEAAPGAGATSAGAGAMGAGANGGVVVGGNSSQMTGAQFSASRFGGGQEVQSGGSTFGTGGGTSSQSAPVSQGATQGSSNGGSYHTQSGFSQGGHASGGAAVNSRPQWPAQQPSGYQQSTANHWIIQPPVNGVQQPNPQATNGQPGATPTNRPPGGYTPGPQSPIHNNVAPSPHPNPSYPAAASKGNPGWWDRGQTRVFTRARQWRHDRGHPYHHRHFVCVNNVIYLVDEGLYDSPDFYVGPQETLYAFDDGYYDTFDASVVSAVQTRLASEGYYQGPVNGTIDQNLRSGIIKYQQDHAITVTGKIDEPLLNELGLL